ncbi:MAG: response regulator [Woeseiaceae bacterium]
MLLSVAPMTGMDSWRIGVTQVNKTALIVDDSRSARFVLKRVLETHELEVDTAESAEDALDYLTENRPDVIFMDHLMPGMDGFEAVSAIKRNPDTATIPIMMYTSQEGEVYVGQARALGAVGVLPKKIAPVEVSKVLQSLRVIGGEKSQSPEPQEPANSEISGEFAVLETLDQDLRLLIQDLFDQQRAVIRRDLLDSYEAIATRVADEIRPPSVEEPDEPVVEEENTSSAFMRAAVVVLAVFTMVFALLYWQREQSWQDMQAQNAEMQRAFESQRVSEAEDSLQVLQQIGDYQQSLDSMYAATISSLEWGANQATQYSFGELPLSDNRLKLIEQLTEQLMTINFSGVVRIETHVANYCLTVAGADGYAPATDMTAAGCDSIGVAPGEAYEMGLGQSVEFANFIRIADQRSAGRIRYEIISLGNSDPVMSYPASTEGVSASAWNRIAAANNRVEISVYPDNF